VPADPPGYSDQSPMTHQARDFSGRTPSVLRRPAILLGPGRRELMLAAAQPDPPSNVPRRRCQRPAMSIVPCEYRLAGIGRNLRAGPARLVPGGAGCLVTWPTAWRRVFLMTCRWCCQHRPGYPRWPDQELVRPQGRDPSQDCRGSFPPGRCRHSGAPRLAPRGQEREHTSYFVTDAEPHPATSGYMGPTRPTPRYLAKE
jgi:hypothetical protein